MHEYLEEQAAHRLTWIVIWLIVAACLVEAVSSSHVSLSSFLITLRHVIRDTGI